MEVTPDRAPAIESLLREILGELRALKKNPENWDAVPVSKDVFVEPKAETSLLAIPEGRVAEDVARIGEKGKGKADVDKGLRSQEQVSLGPGSESDLVAVQLSMIEREISARGSGSGHGSTSRVGDTDIYEYPEPTYRYHWDYPSSAAREEDREVKSRGVSVTEDMKKKWKKYIGNNRAIPPDSRIGLSFDSWTLRQNIDREEEYLSKLQKALKQLELSEEGLKRPGNNRFRITDYTNYVTYWDNRYRMFNEYRPLVYFYGEAKIRQRQIEDVQPPQKLKHSRLLSRPPWHWSAPWLRIITREWFGHQNLLSFHVTFYEVIGPTTLASIVENKMWKAGPLHSDHLDYWDEWFDWQRFRDFDPQGSALNGRALGKDATFKGSRHYLRESAFTVRADPI
ncbi:hypothetical protein L207DRAFT_574691 [Hyaloscypha variabilis F]|uniref:Uncharacterized protein n=1 Tax=Hyaloscypha variabilis (strain UAMH 11265 / GT02V1 / F) TaxID=1149755 RepID=A0A2J6QR69_HYAVF|nr:hypothetical protein L207DRAFT_574691 [Hyaloscypha variabilis F]